MEPEQKTKISRKLASLSFAITFLPAAISIAWDRIIEVIYTIRLIPSKYLDRILVSYPYVTVILVSIPLGFILAICSIALKRNIRSTAAVVVSSLMLITLGWLAYALSQMCVIC